MANFVNAFKKTMGHEGKYVNDPKDRGGETYCGIARNFNPGWKGWEVIDSAKKRYNFPAALEEEDFEHLKVMVREFFKERYWDVFAGDLIQSQLLAEELFDTGVNMGPQRAVLFLQRSINILIHKKGIVSTELLVEDGIFGRKTLTALESVKPDYVRVLYNLINIMQGNHYLEYIKKDHRQSAYLLGWLNRVEIKRS